MLPLLVGVTGHRDIGTDALPVVRRRIREALQGLIKLYGAPQLQLLTAMAGGADLEAAEIALELGIRPVCLFPMEPERYRATLGEADRPRFDRLRADDRIALQVTLPPVASAHGAAGDEDADTAQYEQLAVLLARLSHVLLALWDGRDDDPQPARTGQARTLRRGGTAHVAGIRQNGEYAEVARDSIRGSVLFSSRLPRLELARCGPLLHILTPRETQGSEDGTRAGEVRWWSDMRPCKGKGPLPNGNPRHFWKILAAPSDDQGWSDQLATLMPAEFSTMKDADDDLHAIEKKHGELCGTARESLTATSHGHGADDTLAAQNDADRSFIARMFGAADSGAWVFQQALLGDWAPGLPWRRGKGLRRLGALFWFALALPVMVGSFELYCEYGKKFYFLVVYLGVLLVSGAIYFLWIRRNHWQNRYQDYRALAEAARVQFYWAVSGIPLSVSDNYLRQHEGELGWIRFALRGAALHGMAHALRHRDLPYEPVIRLWMKGQESYFEKTLARYRRAHIVLKRCTYATVGLLVASILALLLTQLAYGGQLPEEWGEILREAPSVLIGVLPAVTAFFIAFQELRLFEEHAHAFEQSARVFGRAAVQAGELARSLPHVQDAAPIHREWRSVTIALGKESLAENAVWIQLHRAHPIIPKAGG
ncbi:MAG: hypothetical protein ABF665_04170 [Gluconacetobacter sp.]